jgi:HSP20 family protein
MAEVTVVKTTKPGATQLDPFFNFETPLFRGNLFGVNPFALMRKFTEEMDDMLAKAPVGTNVKPAWMPAIEVKEKDGNLLVTAELPGIRKEDVKVRIDGDTLVVEGERKEEKEEKSEGFFHTERSYGKFYRTIVLPAGAKTDLIVAQVNNGILEITVPLADVKTKIKEIPIQDGTKKLTKDTAVSC